MSLKLILCFFLSFTLVETNIGHINVKTNIFFGGIDILCVVKCGIALTAKGSFN